MKIINSILIFFLLSTLCFGDESANSSLDMINIGAGFESIRNLTDFSLSFTPTIELGWIHFFDSTGIGLGHSVKFNAYVFPTGDMELLVAQSLNLTQVYASFIDRMGGFWLTSLFIPNIKYGALFDFNNTPELYLELYWFYIFITPYVGYIPERKSLTGGVLFSLPTNTGQ